MLAATTTSGTPVLTARSVTLANRQPTSSRNTSMTWAEVLAFFLVLAVIYPVIAVWAKGRSGGAHEDDDDV